jgi:hypothetical protein
LCSCRKRRRRKHYISNSSNANLQKLWFRSRFYFWEYNR